MGSFSYDMDSLDTPPVPTLNPWLSDVLTETISLWLANLKIAPNLRISPDIPLCKCQCNYCYMC